jgi:nitroreductase/FMN reductase [NAD(P)H]
MTDTLKSLLQARFGAVPVPPEEADIPALRAMAAHRSVRAYADRTVAPALLRTLAAVALCWPTKSDLQQADIILIEDAAVRSALAALLPDNPWAATAPAFAVFCGNNRRQRRLHELRGHAFANDHLDAFFNAAVDAAIVLAGFVAAAEAVGLGVCPISAIRNHPDAVAGILHLPSHVFPVAGLCIGWPKHKGTLSPRLGLAATVHIDRHNDASLDVDIAEYDERRNVGKPFPERRHEALFGATEEYSWSEDKARQYAVLERQGWGDFLRRRGFRLE